MLILFVMVLCFFVYKNIESDIYLNGNCNYTVAKALSFSGRGGAPRYVDYIYTVNNIEYSASQRRDYDVDSIIDRFFKVKYAIDKPDISEMYLKQEVTDTVQILEAGFKIKKLYDAD